MAEHTFPARRSVSGILWVIRAVALVALGVSCYLAWVSATGRAPSGCGPGSDCDQLLVGRWSKWFDVPVSFPAAAVYLGILLAAIAITPKSPPARQRRLWGTLTALAALGAGAAVWFAILQLSAIHQVCWYCMTVHGCGLAIAIAVAAGLRTLPTRHNDSGYRVIPGIRPQPLWPLLVVGAAALIVLIIGQALSSKPQAALAFGQSGGGRATSSPRIAKDPTSRAVSTTKTTATGPSTEGGPGVVERETRFPIGDDIVELDPSELPAIGPSDAPKLVAIMSDYTCPICRQMHPWLADASRRYGDQLVIIILHVPLQKECNPRIKATQARHANACELARLALAVWRVDRAAFLKMDNWLFEAMRKPEDARAFAVSLVGEEAMKKGEADPWIKRTIARNVKLYDLDGGGAIPKLLLTKVVRGGSLGSEKDLFTMLERELQLRPAGAPTKPAPTKAPTTRPAAVPTTNGSAEPTPIPAVPR